MRLIDADALIDELKNDIDLDERALDDTSLVGKERENLQFDKDYKYHTISILQHAPTIKSELLWIPVKYHKITNEEREENGYPKDWEFIMDCEMPDDGQDILVTTARTRFVTMDSCYSDGEYALDSGLDWLDIAAWMPMPEPYEEDMRE